MYDSVSHHKLLSLNYFSVNRHFTLHLSYVHTQTQSFPVKATSYALICVTLKLLSFKIEKANLSVEPVKTRVELLKPTVLNFQIHAHLH